MRLNTRANVLFVLQIDIPQLQELSAPDSPCVRDSEAPLFVDVVVEQHAPEQSRRITGRKAGGDGGGGPPVSPRPLRLQQVLPQDLHQVFVEAGVLRHGGHCQSVLVGHPHACLLGHAWPPPHRLHHQQLAVAAKEDLINGFWQDLLKKKSAHWKIFGRSIEEQLRQSLA